MYIICITAKLDQNCCRSYTFSLLSSLQVRYGHHVHCNAINKVQNSHTLFIPFLCLVNIWFIFQLYMCSLYDRTLFQLMPWKLGFYSCLYSGLPTQQRLHDACSELTAQLQIDDNRLHNRAVLLRNRASSRLPCYTTGQNWVAVLLRNRALRARLSRCPTGQYEAVPLQRIWARSRLTISQWGVQIIVCFRIIQHLLMMFCCAMLS